MKHSPPLSYCAAQVKLVDADRYLCTLFAPKVFREHLFTLYAFNYEIAKIRETVSEPMIGLIRLQWWREAIDELYQGKVREHEILKALAKLLAFFPIPQSHFNQMLDGREIDIDDAPIKDIHQLEAYLENTSSTLLQLGLVIAGVEDQASKEAAHHVGIAYGLTGLLRACRRDALHQKCFIPEDYLKESGVTLQTMLDTDQTKAMQALAMFFCERAQAHLEQAHLHAQAVPAEAYPILLPAVITRHYLRVIKKVRYHIFYRDLEAFRGLLPAKLLWNMVRCSVI